MSQKHRLSTHRAASLPQPPPRPCRNRTPYAASLEQPALRQTPRAQPRTRLLSPRLPPLPLLAPPPPTKPQPHTPGDSRAGGGPESRAVSLARRAFPASYAARSAAGLDASCWVQRVPTKGSSITCQLMMQTSSSTASSDWLWSRHWPSGGGGAVIVFQDGAPKRQRRPGRHGDEGCRRHAHQGRQRMHVAKPTADSPRRRDEWTLTGAGGSSGVAAGAWRRWVAVA